VTGALVLVAALTTAAGCGSTRTQGALAPSAAPTPTPVLSLAPTASADPGAAAHPPPPDSPGAGKRFYVSIGDSYAAGWQPADSTRSGGTTISYGGTNTDGFAYQLAARPLGLTGLTLVNYGCSGATTTSMLEDDGCPAALLGPKAPLYPEQSQADAALAFIGAHRDELGLITVVIGANDVTPCTHATDLRTCLRKPLATLARNLDAFLPRLRAAAGPDTPIVGLTYPDVILGGYVSRTDSGGALATRAAAGFRQLINPTLARRYAAIGAGFVDVTAATGAYIPLTSTAYVEPYGVVPQAVARACQLTYYCQLMDLHPRTAGYTLMADLVEQAVLKRPSPTVTVPS
jgi:lysophospholipase L1-like esterase